MAVAAIKHSPGIRYLISRSGERTVLHDDTLSRCNVHLSPFLISGSHIVGMVMCCMAISGIKSGAFAISVVCAIVSSSRLFRYNFTLARLILRSFEFWLLLLQNLGAIAGLCYLIGDYAGIATLNLLISFVIVLLNDASPPGSNHMRLHTFALVAATIVCYVLLYFDIPEFRDRAIVAFGSLSVNVRLWTCDRIMFGGIFLLKYMYVLVRHPSQLALLKVKCYVTKVAPTTVQTEGRFSEMFELGTLGSRTFSAAILNQTLQEESAPPDRYVVVSKADCRVIVIRDDLATSLFGAEISASLRTKNPIIGALLWISNLSSITMAIIAPRHPESLPKQVYIVGLFGLAGCLRIILLGNMMLLRMVVSTFEFWFLVVNLTCCTIGLCVTWDWDARVCIAILFWFVMVGCIISDAVATSIKKVTRFYFLSILISVCHAYVTLSLATHISQHTLSIGALHIDIRRFTCDRLLTLLIFMAKYTMVLFKKPNSLLLLYTPLYREAPSVDPLSPHVRRTAFDHFQ